MAFENFNAYPQKQMPQKPAGGQPTGGDGNNSGQGPNTPVPDSVAKRFNWGACLLNWIWGLGNKTYITLLIFVAGFIPFVGIILVFGMQIWFGMKGNTWAWQNKRFRSVEHFHENQKKWAIVAVILEAIFLLLFVVGMVAALVTPSLMTDVSGAKNKAFTIKSVNIASEVIAMNEAMEEKCDLTSEGIATCFEKRMNVASKDGSKINASDGTVWTFLGDGVCNEGGICSVIVENKGQVLFTLPLFVKENGILTYDNDAMQSIIDNAK